MGSEHPATLTASANLAIHTGKAGDAAGARDQLAALLPSRERVLGSEHPENLDHPCLPRRFPRACRGCGRGPRPARGAAAIEERVLGPEHPTTLTDRHGLVGWTADGDAAGAAHP